VLDAAVTLQQSSPHTGDVEEQMTNRRHFLRTVAGAAGALSIGGDFNALHAQARREVSVGGRRIKVIDIHCHGVIDVTDLVKGTALEKQAGAGNQGLGPQRLALMDKQGVDVQALTINGFWWYEAMDRELAGRIVRAQNEGLAKWVSAHPDRFVAMASVALQHPDLAAQQL
jgi:aminocarboxymuconate-semialdehyde decarboxylase